MYIEETRKSEWDRAKTTFNDFKKVTAVEPEELNKLLGNYFISVEIATSNSCFIILKDSDDEVQELKFIRLKKCLW